MIQTGIKNAKNPSASRRHTLVKPVYGFPGLTVFFRWGVGGGVKKVCSSPKIGLPPPIPFSLVTYTCAFARTLPIYVLEILGVLLHTTHPYRLEFVGRLLLLFRVVVLKFIK